MAVASRIKPLNAGVSAQNKTTEEQAYKKSVATESLLRPLQSVLKYTNGNFRAKYRTDFSFKTTVNTVALMIIFVAGMLTAFTGLLHIFNERVTDTFVSGITLVISGDPAPPNMLDQTLRTVKAENFWLFYVVLLSLTGIFAYFLTKVMLVPTKQALLSQKRFIGDIAHEIRTPLTALKANTELMIMREQEYDNETRESIKSNLEEIDRMTGIINNLLTLNRLAQTEHMHFADVDMSDVAKRVTRRLGKSAEKKGLYLTIKTKDACYINGNKIALEQVAANLIKNSITHTSAGGSITVAVGKDYRRRTTLTVSDTGAGIDSQELFHIFDPFYRTDSARQRTKGGSGLGLSIADEIVRQHRGKITVKSSKGKGTTFTVILPG
jgi:signal transduction histidine kinase